MSVAFRRESDEEHLEPRFELPLPAGPNLVTPRGLALIEAAVKQRESVLASAEGETAEALRRELRYWHTRRTTAQLTSPPADGSAGFATHVTFRLAGTIRTLAIVGDDEADPDAGRVAWSAPLARALAGAEAGEYLDFNGKVEAIEVIAVEPLEEEA